jgi:hypothetical protein
MPCPSHPPWLDHTNYAWRRVKVMKLLIMKFSPSSCHYISLWPKYSPLHPVLKHPHQMNPILLKVHKTSFTNETKCSRFVIAEQKQYQLS